VQRSQLVQRPGLPGLVAGCAGGAERGAQGAQEIEPAKRQDTQPVQRLREADLLVVAPFAVEPVEQAEQGTDLACQEIAVEQPILGQGLEQLVCMLDPVGDRVRCVLQLLDRLEWRVWLAWFIRLRERRPQRCRVPPRLRLVGSRAG
jgi:hypothetical protein